MTQTNRRRRGEFPLLDPAFWRALCDPTRVAIVRWLAPQRAPRSVSQIAGSGCCRVDLSVVSRHLARLRAAGVVEGERHGKQVLYRVCNAALVRTLREVADMIEACGPIAQQAGSKKLVGPRPR